VSIAPLLALVQYQKMAATYASISHHRRHVSHLHILRSLEFTTKGYPQRALVALAVESVYLHYPSSVLGLLSLP